MSPKPPHLLYNSKAGVSPVALSVAVEPVVSDNPTTAHYSFIHMAEFFPRMCGVRDCGFGDRC